MESLLDDFRSFAMGFDGDESMVHPVFLLLSGWRLSFMAVSNLETGLDLRPVIFRAHGQ